MSLKWRPRVSQCGHNAMTLSCATMNVKAPNEPCRASSQSRDVPRAREDSVVMASQVSDGPRRHFGHVVDGDGTCLFLRTLRRDLFWRVVPLRACYSRSNGIGHTFTCGMTGCLQRHNSSRRRVITTSLGRGSSKYTCCHIILSYDF